MVENILDESLDSPPYVLKELGVHPRWEQERGVSDTRLYKNTENPGEFYATFKKGDMYELHHEMNNSSGHILDNKKPNPRFVVTNMNLVKGLLEKNKPVRIIAPENLINHYHRLSKRVAKNMNATVSDPTYHKDDVVALDGKSTTVPFHKFEITSSVNESILIAIEILKDKNKNPFGVGAT